MSACVYGRCEVCESPVRLPRKTFRAIVARGGDFVGMWLLCKAWINHPAFNEVEESRA